jgi:hypothetical protein
MCFLRVDLTVLCTDVYIQTTKTASRALLRNLEREAQDIKR